MIKDILDKLILNHDVLPNIAKADAFKHLVRQCKCPKNARSEIHFPCYYYMKQFFVYFDAIFILVASLLLTFAMGMRFMKSWKMMPAGMVFFLR